MGLLSLFGLGGNDIKDSLRQGAVIIDVRPPYLYDQGKIRGSLNIPLEQIAKNAGYIRKMQKPVVLCGAGSDSAAARRILRQHGVDNVVSGGSWERVLQLTRSL